MWILILVAYIFLGMRVFNYVEKSGKETDKGFTGYNKLVSFQIIMLWPLILISLLIE